MKNLLFSVTVNYKTVYGEKDEWCKFEDVETLIDWARHIGAMAEEEELKIIIKENGYRTDGKEG